MDTMRKALSVVPNVWRYIKRLEWTEKKQSKCKFCEPGFFNNAVYQDEHIGVVRNINLAGEEHWLIMPKEHIRDIEALTKDDMSLLLRMDRIKKKLLKKRFSHVPQSAIHCGYHRGRRNLGPIILPDIISVHHLHLHVIVKPRTMLLWFKYPSWLKLMWVSDMWVLWQTKDRTTPRMSLTSKEAEAKKPSAKGQEAPLVEEHAPLVEEHASLVEEHAPLVEEHASLMEEDASLMEEDAPLIQ